ncbi:MAG TPA: SBBP repeat-containing protein [Bryobacteraceae bacterium]|nr:SBBP repeat-containing protein [Bryobacteraceae bacterium]
MNVTHRLAVRFGLLLFAVQASPAQTLQWARQFAGTSANTISQIAADATGVYVTGATMGALPGQTAVNIQQDAFLRKYDPAGTELWTHEFAVNNRPSSGFGVAVDSTAVYVAATNENTHTASTTTVGLVSKYDLNGNLVWTRQFGASPQGESALAVAARDGAVYVLGQALVTAQLVPGGLVTLSKLDAGGNQVWKSQFAPVFNTAGYGVAVDATGEYIVGQTASPLPGETYQGSVDGFILKYDPNGKLLWTHEFGTVNTDRTYGVAVNSSGVYVVGSTQGLLGIQTLPTFDFDAYVRKYDLNGNLLWTQQFGTIDREEAFGAVADDTGVDVVGWARSGLNIKTLGGADAFVRRLDNNGSALWTFQTGTVNDDYGYGIALDPNGGLFIGGYTDRNSVPGSPTNAADSFVHKYTPPGVSGPSVLDGGIVNNASFAVFPSPVAPGSIAAIFGTGLNDGSVVTSSAFGPDGKLVTTLGGASVTVGGFPAPLFYSLSGQLGIQIPLELAGQTSAQVQVTVNGQSSVTRTVNLRAESPGIFTQSQDGRGTALCVHQDGVTVITPDSRAKPNEVIICYATGLGAVSPPLATGQPSATSQTVALPQVTIDGIPATVIYSGLTAGLVGFNQINIIVPGLARTNAADPMTLKINGVAANDVTLPVGP